MSDFAPAPSSPSSSPSGASSSVGASGSSSSASTASSSASRPSPPLPSSVLVPLDGSAYADRALPVGRALAATGSGELRIVGVADGDDAEALRPHLVARAEDREMPAAWELRSGDPAEQIVAAAAAAGDPPALVCLASHGRGRLAGAVLGSTATAIVALGHAPVVVVGPAVTEVPMGTGARIVACVDGSAESEQVLPAARGWAARLGVPLTVVTVAEPVPSVSDDEHRFSRRFGPDVDAEQYVERLAAAAGGDDVQAEGVAVYDPISVHEGLSAHLRDRPATLLAMTTHARRGAARAVLGSVAAKITSDSPAPVLLVPLPD